MYTCRKYFLNQLCLKMFQETNVNNWIFYIKLDRVIQREF